MRRRGGLITAMALIAALAASLIGYTSTQAAAPAAALRATVRVAIQNFAFSPATLTVSPGTTVVWTNKDSASHTVTSDTGAWADSGNMPTDKTFSFTFTKPGTYAYHCAYHANMIASVTVTGSAASTSNAASGKAGAALVKLASAKILVTAKGMTLYVFAADPKNNSTCYGKCAKYWPPMLVSAGVQPAASLQGVPGTFGMAARKDGTQQLTYDGAPLYTFLGDKKEGDMNGQGSTASGGYWWVVVAAGK